MSAFDPLRTLASAPVLPEAVKQFFSPLVEYLAGVKGESQLPVCFAKVSSVWVM